VAPTRSQISRSATLSYSPDRVWRRALSRLLICREIQRAGELPLLRLSIHPQDARVPEVMQHWRALIDDALVFRTPVTKHQWASIM